jgi:hypothetical protein
MTTDKDTKTVTTTSEYADRIMAMIDEDIVAGLMPSDVDTFAVLHDYVDANMYVLDTMHDDFPAPDDDEVLISDAETEAANAVMDEVARRLAARAPAVRIRMAETVLFAILAGFTGRYGEYTVISEFFNADPADFEVDDDDVNAATEWLLNGRATLDAVRDYPHSNADSPSCPGRFAYHERLPHADVYACGVCGQHRVEQDDPARHSAAMAGLADLLIDAAGLDDDEPVKGSDHGPVTVNGWIYLPADTMWQGKIADNRWLLIPAGLEAPPTQTPAEMLADWSSDKSCVCGCKLT